MSAVPSRLRQLDLFLEEPPSPAELGAEQAALQARYDSLAEEWKLPRARVVLSTRRATGGVITYGPPHVIRVSSHMSADDRLQTLLHETAHAICFARWGVAEGHSPRFWSLARKLGVARKVRSGDRAPAPRARGERALRVSLPGMHRRVDAPRSFRARAPLRLLRARGPAGPPHPRPAPEAGAPAGGAETLSGASSRKAGTRPTVSSK